jgi:hypothetical protein
MARRHAATPRGAGVIAAALTLLAVLLGPPAGDAAAHTYQAQLWRDHGWQLWDNLWYGGRYSQVNYSLLYYPLAALIGTAAVVSAAVGTAAAAFTRVVRRHWPAHASGSAIAAAFLLPLGALAGTYPFLLGLALALCVLAALDARRLVAAAVLTALTTLAHPLALVFLVVVLGAFAVSHRGWWRSRGHRRFAAAVAAVVALQAVLIKAFANDGAHYPFGWTDAVAITAFCGVGLLLTRGLPDQRALLAVFAGYAALTVASLVLSSPIGGNVERLLMLLGVPLLLIPLAARGFRPRGVAVALLAAALSWQAFPAVAGWRTATEARAASQDFWYPAIAWLQTHADADHRVEVVATADNWEALYLAERGVPLARGWFRQDDFPANAALYGPSLDGRTYRQWMRRVGVRYVLLPDEPLDYSARHEAELLRGGRSGLHIVADLGGWTVYELPDATPIVTPAAHARIVRMTSDRLVLRVDRAGTYRVRVRYTPYWRVIGGGRAACARPVEPWGTELRVRRAGTIEMRFDVGISTMVGAVLGDDGGCAPPPSVQGGTG